MLLLLRQKVTGDMPSGWAGCGRSGPQADATPVAGATNVAPPTKPSRSNEKRFYDEAGSSLLLPKRIRCHIVGKNNTYSHPEEVIKRG